MKNIESGGYTGKMFESEIFAPLSDEWRDEGHFDELRSYRWVRSHQEWNPSDPSNRVANDLHYRVAEKLGLDDVSELKLYSALNSPLDYHYGIDAFFEFNNILFTLDLSTNPHKEEAKADLVIHEKELSNDIEIEKVSGVIAEYIQKRASQAPSIRKVA